MKTNLTIKPVGDVEFILIPEILNSSEIFEDLSLGAKMMYGVFLSRLTLSQLNDWRDKNGQLYIIYSIKELMNYFRLSKITIIRYMNELKKFNLIKKRKRGLGLNDCIYVKDYSTLKKEIFGDSNSESDSDKNSGVDNETGNKNSCNTCDTHESINESTSINFDTYADINLSKKKRKETKEKKKYKNIYTREKSQLCNSCVIAHTCAHERDNGIATFKQSSVNEDLFGETLTNIIDTSGDFSCFSKQLLLNEYQTFINNQIDIDFYGKKYSFSQIFNNLIWLINKKRLIKVIKNQGKNTLKYFLYKQMMRYDDLQLKNHKNLRFFNDPTKITEDDLRNDILKYMKKGEIAHA